jgi:hypothetical protein
LAILIGFIAIFQGRQASCGRASGGDGSCHEASRDEFLIHRAAWRRADERDSGLRAFGLSLGKD